MHLVLVELLRKTSLSKFGVKIGDFGAVMSKWAINRFYLNFNTGKDITDILVLKGDIKTHNYVSKTKILTNKLTPIDMSCFIFLPLNVPKIRAFSDTLKIF